VGKRADVRDVLIYRDADYFTGAMAGPTASEGAPGPSARRGFKMGLKITDLPSGAVVATSSTRRKAQLAVHNPGLKLPDIRGNVLTRMEKLAQRAEMDATILALAGINRLNYSVSPDGRLLGEGVPKGLLATILDVETMLPCVGQGAIGIEVRNQDERIAAVCECLNHPETQQCVIAERSFLAAMGGGCQSPVAAYAEVVGDSIRMRALSFAAGPMRRAEGQRHIKEAIELGVELATRLKQDPA
jgi:hydroxymethylbilane synthase